MKWQKKKKKKNGEKYYKNFGKKIADIKMWCTWPKVTKKGLAEWKNYRTKKLLAKNLTLKASDTEDKLKYNPSSDLYSTFIFKPKDKIYVVAFENIHSILKRINLKYKEISFFMNFMNMLMFMNLNK